MPDRRQAALLLPVEDGRKRKDEPIHDHPAGHQPSERADLVTRHQPAGAGNVSGENRGEFALDRMDRRAWLLPIRV